MKNLPPKTSSMILNMKWQTVPSFMSMVALSPIEFVNYWRKSLLKSTKKRNHVSNDKEFCRAMFCLLPALIYLCVMVCITDFLCSRPVERQECCIFVIVCVFPTQKYRGSLPNATFGPGEKSH